MEPRTLNVIQTFLRFYFATGVLHSEGSHLLSSGAFFRNPVAYCCYQASIKGDLREDFDDPQQRDYYYFGTNVPGSFVRGHLTKATVLPSPRQ